MNTYKKYCPNVFVMESESEYQRGETAIISTKYGKEHEVIIFNKVATKGDKKYYSIVRADGYNVQEMAKAKAERLQSWAESAQKKSEQYYLASQEGKDFLSLGEPIKIGHHSERRHRSLIERNWSRMGKSIEFDNKAKEHESRAEYWAKRADTINLSMPESIEFYEYELEKAIELQDYYKKNPDKREHSFSLTYASKAVKDIKDKLNTAIILWGEPEQGEEIKQKEAEEKQAKAKKKSKLSDKIELYGGFFAFNNEQLREGIQKAKDRGILEDGEKVTNFGQGLYIPSKYKEHFLK